MRLQESEVVHGIIWLSGMKRRQFVQQCARLAAAAPAFPLLSQPAPPVVSVRLEGMAGEERVPVSQIPVFLLQRRPSMNLPFPLPRYSEVSGRDGWAHFLHVPPGVYTILVSPAPPRGGAETWLPQYGGGAPSWRTAETFTVSGNGVPVEFNILLRRGRPRRLTGHAVTEEGRPAAGAQVTLSRDDQPVPAIATVRTGDAGRFDFGFVFPDAYRLRAEWQDQVADEPYLLAPEGTASVSLRLEGGFPLEGRILGKEFLEAPRRFETLRVHALPESGAIFNERTAPVQPDGTFRFDSLAPGRYLLQPSVQPRGFYVERIRLAGVDALGEPIDLHRGYGPLEIEFAPGPGAVSGTVRDSAPATVVLVNQDPKRRHFLLFMPTARTDEKGAFTMENVAPGEYLALAFDRVETRDLMDSLLVERLRPLAETIKVVRAQTASVTLQTLVWDVAAGT